ncbi:hypothetical protein BDV26DRAFT_296979 [Aspergillus bertholletiae]|uniref:Uncharacterized protein n=1 Tax=Aspergillus bertholletiae TaxID=1226010 RepID=A0A5N7AWH5_9EURO|nr:hypothetical protein BDV26DRAFT_296979 [Aspergillus bertholletiae]
MHSLANRSLAAGFLVAPFLLTTAAGPRNASALYPELYAVHSDSTPVFQNVTRKTANRLIRVLQGAEVNRVLEKRDDGLLLEHVLRTPGARMEHVVASSLPFDRSMWIFSGSVWTRELHFQLRREGRVRPTCGARS